MKLKFFFAFLLGLIWSLPGLWAQSSPTPRPPPELDPQTIKEFEQQQQNSNPTGVFVGNWQVGYNVDGLPVNQTGPNGRLMTFGIAQTDGFLVITNKTQLSSKYNWMWEAPLLLRVEGVSVSGVWYVYQYGGVPVTGKLNGDLIELKSGNVDFHSQIKGGATIKDGGFKTGQAYVNTSQRTFRGADCDAAGSFTIRILAKPKDGNAHLLVEYTPSTFREKMAAGADAMTKAAGQPLPAQVKPPAFYFRAEGGH